ncbi:MAG: hypothetical protein K5873_02665 [Treponema sp.]|nr:hypothetical protein [Treponema sp.]
MKKFFITLSLIVSGLSLFALPHVNPSVPDFSGQYVYYADSSFERESYIGIVYYDENTYALRYYAPACGKGKKFKPEKNIHILFSVDPEKENLELTGERILSTIQSDDTDLINYIHDFFYEMTKRRQNAGDFNQPKSEYQDYPQFGGDVTLYFDPLIPIFNLERLESVDHKVILNIVTAGQLVSDKDQSFATFVGIDSKFKDKNHKFKKDKRAEVLEINYKAREESVELKAVLDSSWNAAAENFYTLNNLAVFTVNEVSSPMEGKLDVLKRRLILGTEMVYPDYTKQKIQDKNKGSLFSQVSYHAENDSYTYDFKFIRPIDSKTVGLYTLTVFAGAYESNKKYFNEIIDSFN